jgi:hypothetical protein
MKTKLYPVAWALLVLLTPCPVWAQTTTIHFVAAEPSPVFRITSLVVENSGLSVATEFTEVLRKMELLTLAPSTVEVPNGDLLLSWGGTEEFSRTFAVHAAGNPVEVRFTGNRAAALWSTYALGFGALGFVTTTPMLSQGALGAVPIGAAVVSAAGLVGLLWLEPRVEVR